MQFDQVSVGKKANVFFDGKCVSHTVTLPNGVRKSVGVVLPSTWMLMLMNVLQANMIT